MTAAAVRATCWPATRTWAWERSCSEDYEQPDVRLETFFDSAYSGWDRFGRVVDQRWYDYGAGADRDRFTYGYDRAGNRTYRENTLVSGKDEFYTYDGVQSARSPSIAAI